MACKKSEYIFITEPDHKLLCSICLDLPVLAKQCEDCGKLFCSECIEKNGNRPCPNCRIKNPQFFKDAKSKDYHTYLMCYAINILIPGRREIKELKVRCNNKDRGCQWTGTVGTLDSHVSTCQFVLVSCPNKCEEDGQLTIMKKDLDNHLKTTCPNRAHQCQLCGKKGTYANITEDHDKVCHNKIVLCPNKERGCSLFMVRGNTKQHVRSVCDYTEVACTYESLGCGMRMLRKDVQAHTKKYREQHLTFALDTVKKQSEQLKELTEQNMTLSKNKAFVFKVQGYISKKKNNEIIYSTPFYTHPGGYKMCIRVDLNGNGSGAGTHVSVFTKLLKCYDDQLHKLFIGTVKYELLNQLTDDNHYSVKSTFDDSHDMQVDSTRGFPKFYTHASLSSNPASNIQYLLDDTLYFRVSVTVANHKPWLVCIDQTNVLLSNCDSENNENCHSTTTESDDKLFQKYIIPSPPPLPEYVILSDLESDPSSSSDIASLEDYILK